MTWEIFVTYLQKNSLVRSVSLLTSMAGPVQPIITSLQALQATWTETSKKAGKGSFSSASVVHIAQIYTEQRVPTRQDLRFLVFQSNSAHNKVILQWGCGRQRSEGRCCTYKMAQAFTMCYRAKGTKLKYVVPAIMFGFSVLFNPFTGRSAGQMWPASQHQPTAPQTCCFFLYSSLMHLSLVSTPLPLFP